MKFSLFHRLIASLLILLQGVVGCPLGVLMIVAPSPSYAEEPALPPGDENVVYPDDLQPVKGEDQGLVTTEIAFSDNPSDADIVSARVFAEPLVPIGETAMEGENDALAAALMAFSGRLDHDDVSVLDQFLTAQPNSRWRVGLQTNMAILRRQAGYFSEALDRLEDAWERGKAATSAEGHALANRALGELADLNARFGRHERMKELFDETDSREVAGSAQTRLAYAKQGYWMMTRKEAEGFRCGPYAVNAVLNANQKYIPNPEVAKEGSTGLGTNLKQLKELAGRVGLSMVPAQKSPAGSWPVPMVVHWKVGHFAAITRFENGRYLVKDPTFGGEIWVTAQALDTESSGFGLVDSESGALPGGWVAVDDAQAAEIWGRGGAETKDTTACGDKNSTEPDCPPKPPMAVYSIFKMLGTLQIWDSPVGYQPPFGPAMNFTVSYKHLEEGQPQNFNYANFGPFWECNWVSYVVVDAGGTAVVQLRGGGGEVYNGSEYDELSGQYPSSLYSAAILSKTGEDRYERETPDGTREVYSQVDGTTGRIFLKEIIDPQDNKMILNYDGNLRLTSIVDALGQSTVITYKSNTVANAGFYKIHRVTDPFTSPTPRYAEFTYDVGMTRLEKIRDVIGIESSFIYGEDGSIARMITPYGTTQFYPYVPAEDGTGQGLLVILPDGSKECLESYRGHEMMTYYWDRKAMAMAPGDRSQAEQTHWLLSVEGQIMMDVPQWTKKALEDKVEYTYPQQPPPTESPDPEDPEGTLHYHVGVLSKPATVTRLLDNDQTQTFQYEYNPLGKVTKYTDPVGRTYRLFYAANNLDLLEVRQIRTGNDLLGKVIYNTKHQPLDYFDASGQKTSYTYNARGQLMTITNAKNEVTTATYDGNGYLRQIDGPLSGNSDRVEATYDGSGRVRTVTWIEGPNAADQWTATIDYDALDRVTKVTYPDGSTDENVYSRLDLLRSKDRLGRWTQNTYNALGELSSQRNPAGQVTQFEWCRCGALQVLTDAMNRKTRWTYDVQGRLTRKTYADTSYEEYSYENRLSRLKSQTDPAGNETVYDYFKDNTIHTITTNPAVGFADVPDIEVNWHGDYRRIERVTDSYGEYEFDYYPYTTDFFGVTQYGRGRLLSVELDTLAATVGYEYDELGRVNKRQIDGVANELTWAYDAAGRISSWTNALGTFTPSYVNPGYGVTRLDSVAYPNGQVIDYEWEDKSGDFRLKEIENLGSGSTALSKFEYVTDAVSRIKNWKQQKGVAAMERFDLGYNGVDELTSAVLKTDSSGAMLKQYYYNYDNAGNRTSEQVDSVVKSSTFNFLNQLTNQAAGGPTRFQGRLNEPGTVTVAGQPAWMWGGTNFQANATLTTGTNLVAVVSKDVNNNTRTNTFRVVVPSGASATLTYDNAGNMTSDGTKSYNWDAWGRLVKVTYTGGASSEFGYDAFGRRVKIVEKNSGGAPTGTKQFVWDGLKIAEQRDGSSVTTKRYFSEGWRDVTGSASYFTTKDHLGSIREVASNTGTLVSRYDYDPYGRTTKVSGSVDCDMLYTGHYYHAASGLHLAPYRAYDANLARWITRDPIGEEGGVNLYAYVGNNPINFNDPLGLFLWPWQSPTPVLGGTYEERQRIRDALRDVRRTPRGKELLEAIRQRGEPVNVNVTDDNDASANCPGTNMWIDPDFHPTVETTEGPQPASTESIVGHELGHAVTGTKDDGLDRMNNVNQNENPIRDALGEARRTKY